MYVSHIRIMCVVDIKNVLRTGMNMSVSRIRMWLYNIFTWIFHTKAEVYVIATSVGWGCRRHQLRLCRGVRPPP